MPMAAIAAYLEHLPARLAEMKLSIADAASIPHMKESARRFTQKAWMREIEAHSGIAMSQVVSPARLKLAGIGVRFVQ